MDDIVPELIKKIDEAYMNYLPKKKIQTLFNKIEKGNCTYKDAHNFAKEIANARAKAFKSCINSSVLPDGKMYFNIADRVIRSGLEDDYKTISDACVKVQESINKKSKIGIKAQKPDFNEDGIMGIINRISSEDLFDDIAWILDEPVKVFELKNVDDSVKKNAETQHDIGIRATVTRISSGKCCEWCDNLAGEYVYPNVSGDVFARHDNCRCILEYNGTKLNANKHSFN